MTGGYSVHVGMDLENGELLAVYEWHFQFLKKDARRAKQVCSSLSTGLILNEHESRLIRSSKNLRVSLVEVYVSVQDSSSILT